MSRQRQLQVTWLGFENHCHESRVEFVEFAFVMESDSMIRGVTVVDVKGHMGLPDVVGSVVDNFVKTLFEKLVLIDDSYDVTATLEKQLSPWGAVRISRQEDVTTKKSELKLREECCIELKRTFTEAIGRCGIQMEALHRILGVTEYEEADKPPAASAQAEGSNPELVH